MALNRHPRVTILSPYFCRADAVWPTLQSISTQTYGDFVALIWDDCSPDGTWSALQSAAADLTDSRVQVYRHPQNLGLYAGLRCAFAMVDTEYVAIVGSGDICHPDRLAMQVAALDENPDAPFCATNSQTIDPLTGQAFAENKFNRSAITTDDIRRVVPFTHGTVMYRADSVAEVGGYEPTFTWCGDWDLFFRLLKNRHAVYLPAVLYRRYARPDGASFNPAKSFDQIQSRHLVHILEAFPEQRAKLLSAAQEDLPAVLSPRQGLVVRDLCKRQVKLALMGRPLEAEKLGRLIDAEYGRPLAWKWTARVARTMALSPFKSSTLISTSKRISRMLGQN